MTKKITLDEAIKNFKPKTYVALLLDKSGSMISMKKYAIDTYNEQLQTLKKMAEQQEIILYAASFSNTVDFLNENQSVLNCGEIDMASYEPNGGTALNDAVGSVIDKIKTNEDINNPNVSVLVFVISDGMENASKEYSKRNIADKIKELTDTNRWTFTYLGSNVDVDKMSQDYNIPIGNVQAYESSRKGFMSATKSITRGTERYFGSRMRYGSSTRGQSSGKFTSSSDFYSESEDDNNLLLNIGDSFDDIIKKK